MMAENKDVTAANRRWKLVSKTYFKNL